MTFSVKFFKRMFLIILLLMIIVPLFFAIFNGISLGGVKADNESLKTELARTKEELEDLKKTVGTPDEPSFAYQTLYPELYCAAERPDGWVRNANTVYLTFDDGPSANTAAILDILKANNVKATFFVTGKTDQISLDLMRRIVNEGHTIGIHSYSHQYREIYSSVESYLQDFKQMYDLIYETTGVKPEIFRFAGGSINGYNTLIYEPLISEMTRRGFTYFDWNVPSGDTVQGATAEMIQQNVLQYIENQERGIILFHDGEEQSLTADALPQIISDLRGRGYDFAALTPETAPIIYSYDSIP